MIGQLSWLCFLIPIIGTHSVEHTSELIANADKLGETAAFGLKPLETGEFRHSEIVRKDDGFPQTTSATEEHEREGEKRQSDDIVRQRCRRLYKMPASVALHCRTNVPVVRHRKRKSWEDPMRFRRGQKNVGAHDAQARSAELDGVDVAKGNVLQEQIETGKELRDIIDIPALLKLGPSRDPKNNEPEDIADIALYKGTSTDDVFSTKSHKVHKSQRHDESCQGGDCASTNETSAQGIYGGSNDRNESKSQQIQTTSSAEATSENNSGEPGFASDGVNNASFKPSDKTDWPFQVDSERASYVKINGEPNEGAVVDNTTAMNLTSSPSSNATNETNDSASSESSSGDKIFTTEGNNNETEMAKGDDQQTPTAEKPSSESTSRPQDDAAETYSNNACNDTICEGPNSTSQNRLKEKVKIKGRPKAGNRLRADHETGSPGNDTMLMSSTDSSRTHSDAEDQGLESEFHADGIQKEQHITHSAYHPKPLEPGEVFQEKTTGKVPALREEQADPTSVKFEDSRIEIGEAKYRKGHSRTQGVEPKTNKATEKVSTEEENSEKEIDVVNFGDPVQKVKSDDENFDCTGLACWESKDEANARVNEDAEENKQGMINVNIAHGLIKSKHKAQPSNKASNATSDEISLEPSARPARKKNDWTVKLLPSDDNIAKRGSISNSITHKKSMQPSNIYSHEQHTNRR